MSDKKNSGVGCLAQTFEQWILKQDSGWKEKYKRRGTMTVNITPAPESRVGPSAINTQLLTPDPSPSSSPSSSPSPVRRCRPIDGAFSPIWKLAQLSTPPVSPNSSPKPTSSSTSSTEPPVPAPGGPLFATMYFEVRESPKGGLGAFAVQDIEEDTVIMAEEPLFKATFVEVFYEFEKLSKEKRGEYLSLYAWSGIERHKVLAIFSTNRFTISNAQCGIFLKSSRFNHACHPYATCSYRWDEEKNQMVTRSVMSIKKGQEITIAYSRNPSALHFNYGFWCDCPGCPEPKKAKAAAQRISGEWIY
ncbi:uncharacterized protein BP5553_09880 [Venustampulla echinocandica]|uniref:SET domain-containing protein n=1 Tax=Venustampulla echinocandica TaxID=2656787 RepID=A0A370TAY3_9HELO|nr:uncharacterized protein BP5553_09880 [Venustampulla echinocandica]RDL31091.1 hypothetical protein BP5553_09880 [Venustampulla echinocandica]